MVSLNALGLIIVAVVDTVSKVSHKA